jgi:hypothetical protein
MPFSWRIVAFMTVMFGQVALPAYGQRYRIPPARLDRLAIVATMPAARRRASQPVPGRIFARVKWLSWLELAVFAGLLVVWLAPGMEEATKWFGWAHGLGYLALCAAIFYAIVRREAPYTLLAATLTPVGPLGSVIAIELIERRRWGVAAA